MRLKDGRAEILFIGDIGGYMGGITADAFMAELKEAESVAQDIDIRLHSRGGDVMDGIAIYNAIKESTANVNVYIVGLAGSMGAIIALAGAQVKMSRYARIMTHQASGGAFGQSDKLRQSADLLDQINTTQAQVIAQRTGMDVQAVADKYLRCGVDKWISADEALSSGLVDEIYDDVNININIPETAVYNASLDKQIYTAYSGEAGQKQDILNMDMTQMATALGCPQGSTETQILARAEQLHDADSRLAEANARAKKATDELTAATEELTRLRAEATARAEADRTAFTAEVDTAVKDGRIDASCKEDYMAFYAADPTRARAMLSRQTPHKPITAGLQGGDTPTAQAWDEADHAGTLATLKDKDHQAYAALFRAKFGTDPKNVK